MWQLFKYGLRVFMMITLVVGSRNPLFATGEKEREEISICTSYLVISGESNVNEFELVWTSGSKGNLNGNEMTTVDSSFFTYSIPVKDFEASNFMMYEDFIKLMKAEEFPRIILKISQDQLKLLNSGRINDNPEISITIAGVTRTFNIECSVLLCQENRFILNGTQKVNLKDFQMTPPVKLQGLVKVREEINVSFAIIINFTDQNQKIVSL